MSKSIKLKNNVYLDSSSIVHNRSILSNILNNALKQIRTPLTYETNFNDILEPGYYIYNGWSGNDTGSNRPSDARTMGFLFVLYNPSWTNYMQIYFSNSASVGIKYRWYGDGYWRNWLTISVT